MNLTRRRSLLFLVISIVLFLVIPFLFWRGIWFGAALTDSQMRAYLAERQKPRKVQHALAQIESRIVKGDPSAKVWYPGVVELTKHPAKEVRITVAWVMGQDNVYAPFHDALLQMLRDPETMVRRNAALSLVRFHDSAGKTEILSMLRPFPVISDQGGTISLMAAVGDNCVQGTLLVRIRSRDASFDLTAPIAGYIETLLVRSGDPVSPGQKVILMLADDSQVWEALRALYLIGAKEDLELISVFTAARYPEYIRQQAKQTIAQIRMKAKG